MRELPTGTVTLMFTDIAGSTALLRRLGAGYAEALGDHRRLLREVFARHGGVEVDTQGDAFFVAFARASDAVEAATDAQSRLVGQVRVRIGLHTGEPLLTEEGYIGEDVHVAARIGASANGGQVLLSQTTRELVGAAGTRRLGSYRLKDVGVLELYQLGDESFPELKSLNRTNLPPGVRSVLGRETEAAELRTLLRNPDARLITVVGTGGIGKTCLTLKVARDCLEAFADGVWFVDLAPLTDPGLIEATIAAALGTATDPTEHLRDREVLLVLDNFEQVIDAADTVAAILDHCHGVKVIATSRQPLRVRGETEYPLSELGNDAASALFQERARSVLPSFTGDPVAINELSRRLEGIPLAIELAAARVRILDPEQMLERWDSRSTLLAGGLRDVPERQRTLDATITWSYDLLADEERALFARLAVFAGGWTLEAAEAVCDADLNTLQALVEQSLVRVLDGRFTMLDAIRDYASALPRPAGDDRVLQRHSDYFMALADRAAPELTGADQRLWLDRLSLEYGNLRAVLDRSSDAERLRIGSSLALFWFIRGPYREALYWLEPALDHSTDGSSSARAGALWCTGLMWTLLGDSDRAGERLDQCLVLARANDDHSRIARALDIFGLLAFFGNDLGAARRLFEQSIDEARFANDLWCLTDALATVGSIYPLQGEIELALAAGTEALELARGTRDQQGLRMSLFGLSLAHTRRGDEALARDYGEEGLAISRALDDRWFTPYFLWVLAVNELAAHHLDRAEPLAAESLSMGRELGAPLILVCALDVMAACAARRGDDDEALALLLEAEELGASGEVPGSYVSSALTSLGELRRSRAEWDAAREVLGRSLEIARGVGDPWAEQRALEAQARLTAG